MKAKKDEIIKQTVVAIGTPITPQCSVLEKKIANGILIIATKQVMYACSFIFPIPLIKVPIIDAKTLTQL